MQIRRLVMSLGSLARVQQFTFFMSNFSGAVIWNSPDHMIKTNYCIPCNPCPGDTFFVYRLKTLFYILHELKQK